MIRHIPAHSMASRVEAADAITPGCKRADPERGLPEAGVNVKGNESVQDPSFLNVCLHR